MPSELIIFGGCQLRLRFTRSELYINFLDRPEFLLSEMYDVDGITLARMLFGQ